MTRGESMLQEELRDPSQVKSEFRQKIVQLVRDLPRMDGWMELADLFEHQWAGPGHSDWELPLFVSYALGVDFEKAIPAAAAIACMQISIIIVDDILDDDPAGMQVFRGMGTAANMGQAYQSMAFALLDKLEIPAERRAEALGRMGQVFFDTCVGQQLDASNLEGEENYWQVIRAKSTPFYAFAYELGGIVGGASAEERQTLIEIGRRVGEIIQLDDDLVDALEVPANADWIQGRTNLLMIYANTADHPQRARFQELMPQVLEDEAALKEAQDIIVSSGAVSYVVYNVISRYQEIRELLDTLDVPNPEALTGIFDEYGNGQLLSLLKSTDPDISAEDLLQPILLR